MISIHDSKSFDFKNPTLPVSLLNTLIRIVRHMSLNACLAPLCSMHGMAVTTVEGLGSTKTRLHAVQVVLIESR